MRKNISLLDVTTAKSCSFYADCECSDVELILRKMRTALKMADVDSIELDSFKISADVNIASLTLADEADPIDHGDITMSVQFTLSVKNVCVADNRDDKRKVWQSKVERLAEALGACFEYASTTYK